MPQRPAIIVCERTDDWAEALRLAFRRRAAIDGAAFAPPDVSETRSPAQLRSYVVDRRREGRPPSIPFLAADLDVAERVCEFLAWHHRHGDDGPAIVGLAVPNDDLELTLREAGADVIVSGRRDLRTVVGLYERYLQDLPQRLVFAENERSPDASWRDRLPWSTK